MSKYLEVSSITVLPRRHRKEFGHAELLSLAESIQQHGLFHPILIRQGDRIGEWFLVAGERRLRAVTDIYDLGGSFMHDGQRVPQGFIPYVERGDVSELEWEEAEFEENYNREDLTFLEEAQAVARLTELRQKRAALSGSPPPKVADIALEWHGSADGIHHENTRRQLIVARHAEDPEVQASRTLDDAFKLLRRREENARRERLAEEIGPLSASVHTVVRGDARDWMHKASPHLFDVILTDPPYGIGADEFEDGGGHAPGGGHKYEDTSEVLEEIMDWFPLQSFRLAKPLAHLYLFCDIYWFDTWASKLRRAGWRPFRTPIIWHKPDGNRLPWVGRGPQRKWEMILYAEKGGKGVTQIYPDLVTYPQDKNLGHQAQKPVALYADLLRRSAEPGSAVLDPFAGSGPIIPAAHWLKCRATAIEQDAGSYGTCLERVSLLEAAA